MLQSSSIVILQKFLPSLKALASTLKRSWVYFLFLCSPDNYRIVNNTEEEGHVAVPVHGPEQLGLAGFAPHPDVTPAFILSVTEPKRDPHDDVRPDVNFAVRVVNVRSRVVYFSNQIPGLCAEQWEMSPLKFVFKGNLLEQSAQSIWKSTKDHIIIRDNACNSIRVATRKTQSANRHGLKIPPQLSALLRV